MIARALHICCLTFVGLLPVGAMAAPCPDYFRFVDFGTPDAAGAITRGGPIFRIVQDGRSLLARDDTSCIDVGPLFTDGHAQPIPVVNTIGYLPDLVDPGLADVSVTRVTGAAQRMSQANAMVHQTAKTSGQADIAKGADFVCVSVAYAFTKTVSCEAQNPFRPDLPVVVYCNGGSCRANVIAIDDDLIINADWTEQGATAGDAGATASAMIASIHDFIAAQM